MSADGSVLPQNEIDSLFKQATGKDIASPPAAPSAAPQPVASPVVPDTGPPQNVEAAAPKTIPVSPPPPALSVNQAPPPPPAPSMNPTPTPPPPVPDAAPAPVSAPSPAPSEDILKKIQADVADLTRRMAKVEVEVSMLDREEEVTPDLSMPVQRLSRRLDTVVKELQKVNSRTDGISKGLKGTPDYASRDDFACESCGSRGFVAIPMRCTDCGSEGWWGWWPKKQ
ncbi:MAG: hypothetical protein V3V23_04335 [Dehalococcoidales bacterium]